ncbi:MAG: energy-coupling factor transporter transmembrane protein EcfT [Thermaerobacter sp.]|nr:transporter [Bacillota bacterium]
MLDDIILGQYVPGDSFLHRLDPRTKMILSALLAVLVFVVHTWTGYALYFAFTAALAAVGRIPPRYLARGMRPMVFFGVITFLFQLVFVREGRAVLDLWILTVTDRGVVEGFFMCFRLLLVVLVVLLFTLTTSAVELAEAVDRLLRPLRRVGVNSYDVGLVLSGAIRFVPTLLEQADKVKKAQMARGVVFEQGNLIERGRKVTAILVPLLLNVVRRADELGMAMEARCYQGGVGRTSRMQLRTGARDWVAAAVSVAWGVMLVWAGL